MSKPPSFQWYPKDCDTDENVRLMDDRELGFYLRCLNHSWLNRGIPADPKALARVMKVPLPYVRRVWANVGPCFVPAGDGRLVNPKQEEQRSAQERYSQTQSESGKVGAKKRWGKDGDPNGDSNGVAIETPMGFDSSASATATATPTTTTTAAGADLSEWPESVKAIQGFHPEADGLICRKIILLAVQTDPGITDSDLARGISLTHKRNQDSPALWLHTLPTWVRNTASRRQALSIAEKAANAERDAEKRELAEKTLADPEADEQTRQWARKVLAA